jgi:hypothetical protein
MTIENAVQEMTKSGDKLVPRYTLAQLLADDFRLPRPVTPDAVSALKKMASQSKAIRYHKVE